jgi:putative spermidine/putrescine transport system permease protein
MSRRNRMRTQVLRVIALIVFGLFFLTPIGAMFEFSTRGNGINASRTWVAWTSILTYPDLTDAIKASLALAAITSVAMLLLLLPTMVWVRLRIPAIKATIEFICLLPLTIPAIVLIVGLSPIYYWIALNVSDNILTLAFGYVILVLPYAYRSLDAGLSSIDVKTLTEAARSLGASWPAVMWRIIVPNIPVAILNALLLSVALVLGEYTFANLLNYTNLQVAIALLGRANAGVSISTAVASLMFAFILLMVISFVGRRRAPSLTAAATDPQYLTAGQRT